MSEAKSRVGLVGGLSAYQIARVAGITPTPAQAAVLKSFGGRGERLDEPEQIALSWLTGTPRGTPLPRGVRTWVSIFGRQCGKTDVMTACAIVQVAFDPALVGRPRLPGQRFAIFVVGVFVEKTRKILNAVRGLLDKLGIAFDEREGELSLQDVPVDIRSMPMSTVHASSDTAIGIFLEDFCLATSAEGSPRQDHAFVGSVMPMLAQTNGIFFSFSQAHARDGWQYEMVEKHFGRPTGGVVALKGATFDIFPGLTRRQCFELAGGDERTFRRQYVGEPGLAEDALLNGDDIAGCVIEGRRKLAREPGIRYAAAADLGFRHDHTALSVGHREERRLPDGTARDVFVEDALRVWKPRPGKPLDPEATIVEMSLTLRSYGVVKLGIDQYSQDLATSRFRHHGIEIEIIKTDVTSQSRRAELFMSKTRSRDLELLDDPEANRELERLRMQLRRMGSISYAAPATRHDHDDRSDARFALVERLQSMPAASVGVKSEISFRRDEVGRPSVDVNYYREVQIAGLLHRVPAAPPKGTEDFDRWARSQIEKGIVGGPELDGWVKERLGVSDLSTVRVEDILELAHEQDKWLGPAVPVREF